MNTKWRVVLAVVVAFVVGAGAGAYGEHARLKHSSNKKSASTATTALRVVPATLFGARAKDACPALKQWNASAIASYKAMYSKAPWKTTSAELAKQSAAAVKAYEAMMQFATPAGKATLHLLAVQAARHENEAKTAKSFAAYVKTTNAQQSPLSKRGINVVARAATTCAAT